MGIGCATLYEINVEADDQAYSDEHSDVNAHTLNDEYCEYESTSSQSRPFASDVVSQVRHKW